jgi:hypothetical protein
MHKDHVAFRMKVADPEPIIEYDALEDIENIP